MARRKNYSFERAERDRQKAAKKIAKREAKAAAKNAGLGPDGEPLSDEAITAEGEAVTESEEETDKASV